MTKNEFLTSLREKLQGLPKEDIDERLNFYEEAINDRIDDGKSEEEAVADLGTVDQIVEEIAKDTKLFKLVKERMKPKRRIRGWEIAIIICSFPFWFPFVIVGLVLGLVFYFLIWVGVIVSYSCETAFVGGSITSGLAFLGYLSEGEMNLSALGCSIACAGLALLFVPACIYATKGTIKFSRFLFTKIKAAFIRKGE